MERITKTNLLQFILGLVLTAICGIDLKMGLWGMFPCMIASIIWGGLISVNTSGRKESTKAFWKAVAWIMSGAVFMGIVLLGL